MKGIKMKVNRYVKPLCVLSVAATILLLSGCQSMMSPPTCPDSSGLQCARTDQINTMINRGQLGVPSGPPTPVGQPPAGQRVSFKNFSKAYPSELKGGQPLWYGESVMQVWVAPFEDNRGNYHEASHIDTVVKPGHWIGNPPKSVLS